MIQLLRGARVECPPIAGRPVIEALVNVVAQRDNSILGLRIKKARDDAGGMPVRVGVLFPWFWDN